MTATVTLDRGLRLIGTTHAGLQMYFDTTERGGGSNSAPSPAESLALSAAACSSMDVIEMIRKRRCEIRKFDVDINYERATEHPKVITMLHMSFRVVSKDLTPKDLARFVELSHTKYCTVSIMLARAGCEITYQSVVERPNE